MMLRRQARGVFFGVVVPRGRPGQLRSVVTKTSTGLVGLEVDPNGRENFIKQCEAILEALKPIPEWSGYRIDVEKIINFRLNTARAHTDEEKIEEIIGNGQLEELMDHGEDELKLIDMYIEEKMWDQVKDQQFVCNMAGEDEDQEEPQEEPAK